MLSSIGSDAIEQIIRGEFDPISMGINVGIEIVTLGCGEFFSNIKKNISKKINNPNYVIDINDVDNVIDSDSVDDIINKNKFPPRTLEAQQECQKVVEVANELKSKVGKRYKTKNPAVSVFTHENRTVSVSISGENDRAITFAQNLQNKLDSISSGKYTVGLECDSELVQIMKGNHKKYKIYEIKKSNKLGVCAEPKVVSVARKNNSKITGMDIRWRLDDMKKQYPELEEILRFKPNPHLYNKIDKVSDSQMNPCYTCELYEEEYIKYARGVDSYE